jgi:hypothetical protein
MMSKKLLLIVAAVAALSFNQKPAEAGYGLGAWGGFSPWYMGYSREYVPYYAMHPPVYYSYPVPRAYGWSPWAYPPGVMTPEILGELGGPQEIINPHVPQPENAKPTANTNQTVSHSQSTGPIPQVVINPYVGAALAAE